MKTTGLLIVFFSVVVFMYMKFHDTVKVATLATGEKIRVENHRKYPAKSGDTVIISRILEQNKGTLDTTWSIWEQVPNFYIQVKHDTIVKNVTVEYDAWPDEDPLTKAVIEWRFAKVL